MAADNKVLGNFDLTGIAPAARGTPQIEVTFDIDANGIVAVLAKDRATGKEQQIKIAANGGLDDADIKRMVQEAETNAVSDKATRAFVDFKNQAHSMIHDVEKTLAAHGSALPAADTADATAAVSATQTAADGTSHDALTKALDHLAAVAKRIDASVQQAASAATQKPHAGTEKPAETDENVVDAEFEDISGTKG